jgi:Zn-dependent protease
LGGAFAIVLIVPFARTFFSLVMLPLGLWAIAAMVAAPAALAMIFLSHLVSGKRASMAT